ncbi:hypothetical protein M076_4784 [Bacteroides fragilis str. 2-F-2 |uniref:Uncharacterized protein n=1 Tax=Bacteroides fragilis str. 2-F-2 \|nr:hypothetical protein M077_4798 [Bacteroides fragilis str. 2-F-2 \
MELQTEFQRIDGQHVPVQGVSCLFECYGTVLPPVLECGRVDVLLLSVLFTPFLQNLLQTGFHLTDKQISPVLGIPNTLILIN